MKKLWIGLSIAIFVVILIVGSLILLNHKTNSYDNSKEQSLGLAGYMNRLTECNAIVGLDRANLSESLRNCPGKTEQTILDKLNILSNVNGVSECNDSIGDKCYNITKNCANITNFEFKPDWAYGINSPDYFVKVSDCGNKKYYFDINSAPPPRENLYRIQLTDEQISGLK